MAYNYLREFAIKQVIVDALKEDIEGGDYTSLATIPKNAKRKAKLLVKDDGILAGVELAKMIFAEVDSELEIEVLLQDGDKVKFGDVAFYVSGHERSILTAERVVLNFMQRMSGIATVTKGIVEKLEGTKCKVLDTRKTTPGMRIMEKWAVLIGGGTNHRFGLFDMILIKDNHIDYAKGIENALNNTFEYLKENNLSIPIEIEVRNLEELNQVLKIGGVDRIMLDNFDYKTIKEAVKIVNGRFPLEASGGINPDTVRDYALCGVDYVSMGYLTHSVKSLDLSLKAVN